MLASTSCNEIAETLLAQCLAGGPPELAAVSELVDRDCSEALFRTVVEGLADRFEPRLCDAYADIFSDVIARVLPGFETGELRRRYERIRRVRVCDREPARVVVLSRVTLGADIAVTSVLLDAAKKRFPKADIVFAGSAKAVELFAGDARIVSRVVAYPRSGSLRERLGSWSALAVEDANSLVIDPDSRLTQLGLLPVCPEENYFFFESRGYGGEGHADLSALTRKWARDTFGCEGAPYFETGTARERCQGQAAVSLGVGENAAKRIGGDFEPRLLKLLSKRYKRVVVDVGAGGEEAARVNHACEGLGNVEAVDGSFASFASRIAESELYVGYDSAGQHAAAACGTPLVTIFAGYVSERMFQRWRPSGAGPISIVKAEAGDPERALAETSEAIRRF